MKKTLIALAALGAMAGGVAHAQSSVTLYGVLDASIQSFKSNVAVNGAVNPVLPATTDYGNFANGATIQSLRQTNISDGALSGSRWGIRTKEDVGGGMFILGNLESGFDISTGATGALMFNRQANVGVSSGFGTLRIGRINSPYDDVTADNAMMEQSVFDPSSNNNGNVAGVAVSALGGDAASAAQFMNRANTWLGYNSRFSNSVRYDTPDFSGFSASVLYAFGEDKTQAQSASKTVSASLKYANGPLLVSGAYQSEGVAVDPLTGAKPALQNALLSVAYDFGVAKVGAGFNRAKYKDVIAPLATLLGTPGNELAAQNEWNLSVAVPLGATTLSAGYAQSKGDDLGKSSGYGIQALYSLSKRTTLYAGAQSTKAYDKVVDAVNAIAPGSDIGRTTTYGLGIRHTF